MAHQHLDVDAPMGALLQSLEGVGAVGRVEVGTGGDGVLPVGLGVAGFAQRQGVVQEVIVPACGKGGLSVVLGGEAREGPDPTPGQPLMPLATCLQ